MSSKPIYKRVLLKASGESPYGRSGFRYRCGGCRPYRLRYCRGEGDGREVGVVVGGGNIFRGVAVASKGGDRVTGDHMGMLATVINALALATSLRKLSIDTVVLSAIAMPENL
ncbi:uridylate kinase [Agrobacterium tumefaciens]|nr:uridylate kinase [Agrobacterium tumefaciens]